MFAGWGSWVARFRWPVLTVALVAVISAGAWGLGVFGELTEGGYNDPNSESTHAGQLVRDAFGAQGGDLVVIYTPTRGKVDDPELTKRVTASLAALPKSAVDGVNSYWAAKSAQYAAKDKSSAVAVISLAGDDDAAKLDSFRAIDDRFDVDGARVQLSGATVLADASSSRSTDDLGTAELISLPITLVLLVLIFGSVVAASLPVLVGGAAVAGSLGILHAITTHHEVNSFAVNVASLLGLGMAIDYGLFMVGRFREEQAEGRTPAEAVARTVGTAGRTVVFSATLLMIALAGLLLFPQGFLNSLAYGGLAAVFLAAVLSLTLLPAMLAVLGPGVDRLPVRFPRRAGAAPAGSGWAKLARAVLRRPLVVAVPILAGLLLLASPVRGVHFGESDERILPASDPARQAIETLKSDYPQFTGDGVQIVLRDASDSAAFAVALRQIPGISQITPARRNKDVTVFTATLQTKDAYSDDARDVVEAIRALPVPPGAQLLVGGTTARNVDSLAATAGKLPWMVAMLVGATLLLMFLAFGSVLLPIKAVLMSALSLSATCGALVWIFQDGHFADLLNVTPAPLEVGIVVLMAAVVFGLSTDYEVFLLSRMVEARSRGATTDEAVTTGLARTGRVISAAALLLIVVTGAFALSAVATMRFVGIGMIIALFLDATVVRMLLVPAVLRLLGDAAWWAPGPLRRLQRRAALSEYATSPAEAAGRHAASDDTVVIARIAPESEFTDFSELLADEDEPVSGEIVPALPAAAARLALPAADADATEVFARFDETAVLSLPPAPTPTEDEFAAVEFRPQSAAATPGFSAPSEGPGAGGGTDADDTVPEDEPVVAATALEPYDPDAVDAEIVGDDRVEADFVASGTADDEPWFPAAGPYEEPGAPGRVVPADLSEWLPAVPAYETPAADWSSGDDGYYFTPSRPADGGPLALPAGLGMFDSPWQPPPPAPLDTAEPEDEHSGTTDLTRFGPTVDLVARLGQRPESHAEPSQPAWNTTNSVSRPTDLGSYTQERRPAALGGNPAARRPSDRDDQIPPRRPPAFGDPAQLPHPPEPPMTIQPDPTTEPQAGTAEPVRRPADLADHLRESRPADLSQYTESPPRIPRMRRPDDAEPAPPVRRPATLADHLSTWRPVADEDAGATRDLRDHLDEEGDPAPR